MSERPVLLITGASKGIGAHLALHYVERGYQVVGCSRGPSSIEADGYRHVLLDVGDEPAVNEMFRGIRKEFGRLDALVNNAGVAAMNHSLLTPMENVAEMVTTNFVATFLFCREAAKMMSGRQSGRIVNFTSVAVPLRLEGEAAYASSKAAVEALTGILSKELAPYQITVNAVGPGPVETDLIRSIPSAKLEELLARQAFHRFTEMDEVAHVVDFFLSPDSRSVTGQVIYLGGV